MKIPRVEVWFEFFRPGTLTSFSLAVLLAVAGLGLPLLYRLREVLRQASRDSRSPADAILVLGRNLENGAPSQVFMARLAHGAELYRDGLAPRIIVAGGLTGGSDRTEAEVGREVLLGLWLPEDAVYCEGRSRHTLENLRYVRETLKDQGWRRLLVVSDPLHLARVSALARGLGLDFSCSPAVAAAGTGIRYWLRALRESFFLHWYHTGIAYSRLIRSEKLLSRVR